jgi:hypothetical protein
VQQGAGVLGRAADEEEGVEAFGGAVDGGHEVCGSAERGFVDGAEHGAVWR